MCDELSAIALLHILDPPLRCVVLDCTRESLQQDPLLGHRWRSDEFPLVEAMIAFLIGDGLIFWLYAEDLDDTLERLRAISPHGTHSLLSSNTLRSVAPIYLLDNVATRIASIFGVALATNVSAFVHRVKPAPRTHVALYVANHIGRGLLGNGRRDLLIWVIWIRFRAAELHLPLLMDFRAGDTHHNECPLNMYAWKTKGLKEN